MTNTKVPVVLFTLSFVNNQCKGNTTVAIAFAQCEWGLKSHHLDTNKRDKNRLLRIDSSLFIPFVHEDIMQWCSTLCINNHYITVPFHVTFNKRSTIPVSRTMQDIAPKIKTVPKCRYGRLFQIYSVGRNMTIRIALETSQHFSKIKILIIDESELCNKVEPG